MTAGLTVTVIVPLHNGRDLIAPCLSSVPAHAELIVVDDASTDGAPEVVARDFPRARLLHNERNLGFAATCNRGLAASTSAVRVLLNSDARLSPGSLDVLLAAFDDPAVGIAGPRLVFPDGSHQTSAARFPTIGSILAGSFLLNDLFRILRPDASFRWELGMARRDHGTDREVDWVMGTCLAIHERCLADVEGFDEGYSLFVEETDLCWRARAAGWTVRYVSGSVVEHLGGGSAGDERERAVRYLRGERRFFERAYGPSVVRRWRLARLIGSAAKAALLAPAAAVSRAARRRLRWQVAALRHLMRSPS